MKQSKSKSWEQISEGLLTTGDINQLLEKKMPIVMSLSNAITNTAGHIVISHKSGKRYEVFSNGVKVGSKNYKYLSCAIRCAVKQVKTFTKTGQWRVLPKI